MSTSSQRPVADAANDPAHSRLIAIDHPAVVRSPYTWKAAGTGKHSTIEACMPGAYLRLRVAQTTTIALEIDGRANAGCPAQQMPVIEYAIDDGPLQQLQLPCASSRHRVTLGQRLDAASDHGLELYFRAGTLIDRWLTTKPRLRIGALVVDAAAALLPCPRRELTIIGWGDSITEGVGVDALFTSWSILSPNNARGTWLPIASSALGGEYGQLGTGGQSLTAAVPGGLPPLTETWSIYDSGGESRLNAGRLSPAPDLIFCNMGTNDRVDPSAAYLQWLRAVRAAAPEATILVVVPINGFWRSEITAMVAQRRGEQDPNVHLIDCPHLQASAPARGAPTSLALDGVHPTLQGEALYGAAIAVQTARLLRYARSDPGKSPPGG